MNLDTTVEQLCELQVTGLDSFCRVYVMVGKALSQTSRLNCAHCVCKVSYLISPLQTDATLLVVICCDFCTLCYMLLRVVGSCCAKFDTSKTFELTTLKISLICSVIAEA